MRDGVIQIFDFKCDHAAVGIRREHSRRAADGQRIRAEFVFDPYALAIGCAPGMFTPHPDGCMAALEVENFDDAIAHLKQHNVKFRMEPMECPPCNMAMVHDPDGNTICIHKRKAK